MKRLYCGLRAVLLFLALAWAVPAAGADRAEFDNGRVGFTVRYQGIESDMSVMTATVMPGAELRLRTVAAASSPSGRLKKTGDGWIWTAGPKPGRAELVLSHRGEQMLLNVFVLTPFRNGDKYLNGFRVGDYDRTPFRGLSTYAVPRGLINLAHGPADLRVSPHFRLGQFVSKQQPGHRPAYLLVRPSMLLKLERLLEAANRKGWRADTFHIMSGFRTPFYNRAIGNRTSSSRHLYGGAADIWIDGDGDGQMDDLNGDGRIDKDDARVLAALAESLARRGGPGWPPGGIGVYGANAAHGPFVHIDSRGYRARW